MFKKLTQFKEMKKIYTALSQEVVTATGAGGKIKITMNGAFQVTDVNVDPTLLEISKKSEIEKGIKDAIGESVQNIFKKLADKKDTFAGLTGMNPNNIE